MNFKKVGKSLGLILRAKCISGTKLALLISADIADPKRL